jgi:predicted ATPase
MAVHTGECTRRDDDYFGQALNRTARLLAIGHGGQTLVSGAARAALDRASPSAVGLRDLGEHRLRDLDRPERVFQVCRPDLVDITRPLSSVDRRRHNLPAALTSFTGRQAQTDELQGLLRDRRLVTVTGAGGCGKSRLALRVAERLIDASPDGVWLVELAALQDPELVEVAVASAVGVRSEGVDALPALVDGLQDRRLVIVMDNCEHLIESCARVAHELVRSCPGLTVLATSREPLAVEGEVVFWLPSLTVPERDGSSPEEVLGFESVQLLADRIRERDPRFEIDGTNAASVAEICRRLDGIPLALELVAARTDALTLDEVRDRLDERFTLLTRGSRSALPRQQTLGALIDWSYVLLDPAEQQALCRCSVFAGTFDLGAAEAVCGRDPIPAADVVDLVSTLVAKNLVQRDAGAGRARYRLLETVRQYAADRLARDEGEPDASRSAHCDHFVALAERTEAQLEGPRQAEMFERLGADLDNFRAALSWSSLEPERAEGGLRLAGALTQFWFVRALFRETLDRISQLLAVAEDAGVGRARASWTAGFMAVVLGEQARAETLLGQSLDLARRADDRSLIARSLDLMGLSAFFANELADARPLLEESIAEARAVGDRWCLTDALGTLGSILPLIGEPALGGALCAEGVSMARETGDDQGVRMGLFGLALAAHRQDDVGTLIDAAEEGLAICRSIGDPWFVSYFSWLLALGSVELGDLDEAHRRASEALEVARQIEGPLLIACALEAVASVASARGDASAAAAALEEASEVASGQGVPGAYHSSIICFRGELAAIDGRIDEARMHLDEAARIAAAVGDRWGVDRARRAIERLEARG